MKALFKVSDKELTFDKAVQEAVETEDAARVAKVTVHGSMACAAAAVPKVSQKKASSSGQKGTSNLSCSFPKGMCLQCGKKPCCKGLFLTKGAYC